MLLRLRLLLIPTTYPRCPSTATTPLRLVQCRSGGPEVPSVKNPQLERYRNGAVEVSLDVILLGESQRVSKDDLTKLLSCSHGMDRLQHLDSKHACRGLLYVVIRSVLFSEPIYGILDKDLSFKVFIQQEFKERNDQNLKNLLMALFEFTSDVIIPNQDEDVTLLIYMKRDRFESESKLLIKNLIWLGGKLVHDDSDETNKYHDWYIMEFEV